MLRRRPPRARGILRPRCLRPAESGMDLLRSGRARPCSAAPQRTASKSICQHRHPVRPVRRPLRFQPSLPTVRDVPRRTTGVITTPPTTIALFRLAALHDGSGPIPCLRRISQGTALTEPRSSLPAERRCPRRRSLARHGRHWARRRARASRWRAPTSPGTAGQARPCLAGPPTARPPARYSDAAYPGSRTLPAAGTDCCGRPAPSLHDGLLVSSVFSPSNSPVLVTS